jgi:polyisoprenoid-binding protein YceI
VDRFKCAKDIGATATDDEMVEFRSTAIEVTGETTARITGDLTLNGVTKPECWMRS